MRNSFWLALTVVVIAAIAAGAGTAPKPTFLDHLKPGQAVTLDEKDGRYEIGVMPNQVLGFNVVEIGQDFVTLRDIAGVTDTIVPVYSIKAVKVLRIGGKQRRAMSEAGQ